MAPSKEALRAPRRPRAARNAAWILGLLGAALAPADLARGGTDGSVRYDFRLERSSDPDFDTTGRIDAAPGEDAEFAVELLISSSDVSSGPQGWSLGVWHGGLSLLALETAGTAAARVADGGFLDDNARESFISFHIIDPDLNQGREGVVQAVILSTRRPVTLPPNSTQSVGRLRFRARAPSNAFVRYEEDLRGPGQPVDNVATIAGQSVYPSLAAREIRVGEGAASEAGLCDDGIDNDADGFADCADPECRGEAICGAEICDDGVDNDGDRRIDCADLDCRAFAGCVEICDDGIDNDRNGEVDCEDIACRGRANCPDLENCADGVDNDLDGAVDCEDADCIGHPACRAPEICDDGIDNNLDGAVDCLDTSCHGVGDCPQPENCTDEIDNDEDGRIDCADPDCFPLAICRSDEVCDDGVDNDIDGRVDCEDIDCADRAGCPPLEICDSGRDEDGDGLIDCADPSCDGRRPCGTGGFDMVLHADGAQRIDLPVDGLVAGPSRSIPINLIEGTIGEEIEVTVYLVPFPGPQETGAQGWSLSVDHDERFLGILGAPTIAGTDADALLSGGFEKSEVATDPDGLAAGAIAGGAGGFVSAVVLSFTQPITLDPTRAQSLARASYRVASSAGRPAGGAVAGSADEIGGVSFRDGLRGSGQPVSTVLTIQGSTVRPIHFVPIAVRRVDAFRRGDVNDDGQVDLADVVRTVNELFRGGPVTPCPRAGDSNEDGRYNLSDAMYSAYALFQLGPSIPPPYPGCGGSRSPTPLPCPLAAFSTCE